jgi:hypothetical protein
MRSYCAYTIRDTARNKILHISVTLRASGYCADTARILLGYSTDTAHRFPKHTSWMLHGYCSAPTLSFF